MNDQTPRVAAIILTYNAPDALERCLTAVAAQTRSVDTVLITDNASRDRVDDIAARFPNASVTRLSSNLGPAGGYAAALEQFLDSGNEFAWVLDDDCMPTPDALATQLATAGRDRVVLATVTWAESSEIIRGHGWWGALIPREVVATVGVPNAELFWWTEDTEYLQWRIPRRGYDVDWTEEVVGSVSRARPDSTKPAWKYYYEARNQVFHRLYVQRPSAAERSLRPRPRHLQRRARVWRSVQSVGKLAGRAVFREHDDRARKVAMVARGGFDGVRGRLGRTVIPDRADRPSVPTRTTNLDGSPQ